MSSGRAWKVPKGDFPEHWRLLLQQNVPFYNSLSAEDRQGFEYELMEFLSNCQITGVKTKVEEIDKVLIGSSAIIPIFAFPEWKYFNLQEVLLYPGSFNENFEIEGSDRRILGMVGSGYMDGKMILSKHALRQGFKNESDKKNTAIHEFVHLIDKKDGSIDGIPSALLERQYILPWLDLIEQEVNKIRQGKSDINPYGATNQAEFFAVLSEYFFERPILLKKKHPQLYGLLEKVFNQQMTDRRLKKMNRKTGRNDPCPCGSGKKYKYCCFLLQ